MMQVSSDLEISSGSFKLLHPLHTEIESREAVNTTRRRQATSRMCHALRSRRCRSQNHISSPHRCQMVRDHDQQSATFALKAKVDPEAKHKNLCANLSAKLQSI
jgi:hypothetical protein